MFTNAGFARKYVEELERQEGAGASVGGAAMPSRPLKKRRSTMSFSSDTEFEAYGRRHLVKGIRHLQEDQGIKVAIKNSKRECATQLRRAFDVLGATPFEIEKQ